MKLEDLQYSINDEILENMGEFKATKFYSMGEIAVDIFNENMAEALSANSSVIELIEDLEETLDFLIKRNASRESIAGMSVMLYKAKQIDKCLDNILNSGQISLERGV